MALLGKGNSSSGICLVFDRISRIRPGTKVLFVTQGLPLKLLRCQAHQPLLLNVMSVSLGQTESSDRSHFLSVPTFTHSKRTAHCADLVLSCTLLFHSTNRALDFIDFARFFALIPLPLECPRLISYLDQCPRQRWMDSKDGLLRTVDGEMIECQRGAQG